MATLHAADGPCDPQLPPAQDDPNAYRLRGDRCEGIYIKQVAGGALRVVSLTESFEDYDPTSGGALVVEWTPFGDGAVHLRADQVGRPHFYYRMDALRPPGEKSFTWPSGMLSVFTLKRAEIGVVGWTSVTVGHATRDVYLPLRIRQKGAALASQGYDLEVASGAQLNQVFVSVAAVGEDGQPTVFLKKDEPLQYGYYPPDRKIRIRIPAPGSPGLYSIELDATLAAGGSSAATLWFYHHGG